MEISRNAACSLAAIVGLPLAVVVPGAAAAAVGDTAPTTPTTCLTSVPSIGPSYAKKVSAKFGYRMNNKTVQVFDYVVAINFNRNIGKPPRDEGRPNPKIRDGGIWFHVSGAGATRGCVSVKEANMAWTLRWLKPGKQPMIVMGPKTTIKG